jgi:hypothetical protein
MSTRSIIKIISDNNTIHFYRHWDGYLEEGGYELACLLKANRSYTKFIKALINQQRPIYEHDMGHPLYELVYGADMGEEYTYYIEFKYDYSKGIFKEAEINVTEHHYKKPDIWLFKNYISIDKFMKICSDKKYKATQKEIARLSA